MALDTDARARVETVQQQLQAHQDKLSAGVPPPRTGPLFVKLQDGSVHTYAGVEVKAAPPPPKPKQAPPQAKPSKAGA